MVDLLSDAYAFLEVQSWQVVDMRYRLVCRISIVHQELLRNVVSLRAELHMVVADQANIGPVESAGHIAAFQHNVLRLAVELAALIHRARTLLSIAGFEDFIIQGWRLRPLVGQPVSNALAVHLP